MPARSLRCRTVGKWLTAAHDRELSVARQVALDTHVAGCTACRRAGHELSAIGAALRHEAAGHRPDEAAFVRVAPAVLARLTLEHDVRWGRRLGNAVEDGGRLWVIGGAVAATIVAALLVAAVLSLATPMHPRSLAGLLQASNGLGSNANPLGPATGISLPACRRTPEPPRC